MKIFRRTKRLPAAFAAVAVSGLLAGGVALADNLHNDVVAGGNDTIVAGGSTTVNYHIAATGAGNDGQSGCNAADSTPATVTISAPAGVTASPSSLTFTACGTGTNGQVRSVVFSSNTPGNYPISAAVSDSGVGSYTTTHANFTLRVGAASAPPPPADSTGPVIEETINGTLGSNGWYTSSVSLSWSLTDLESAISGSSGCGTTNITADQLATDYTCSATSAGGTSERTVSIKRDATAPTNVRFVGGPAEAGNYFPTTVPAEPTCTADDAISGVASCVVTGYSSIPGWHTMTATATDNAGNISAPETRSYNVRLLTLSGFFAPVDMGGVVNTVKNGATVPLKFKVLDEGVAQTSTSVVSSFKQRLVACGALGNATDDVEIVTTGGTALRYDANAGQFVQNWQTPKSVGACYVATVTFIDGSSISANFKLK